MDAAKPPCRKPLKKPVIPKDALCAGPFVLTKGRGQRWSLKGVKGFRFVVRKWTWSDGFTAYVTVLGRFEISGRGDTPKKAAQDAIKNARQNVRNYLADDRRNLQDTQRDIERGERNLEILTTGKAPKVVVDRKKPKGRKP